MTTELIRLPQLREPGPGEVRLSGIFHPFRFDARRDYIAPAGATIAEMLAATGADPILLRSAYVFLGDDLIARDYWHVVRPKPGTAVTVRVVPQGGGGGKNPLATVLSIAVLVAAPYIGAALAPGLVGLATGLPIAGGSIVATTATVLTGVVGTLGLMAVNAIVPPPRPDAMSSRGLDGSGGTTYSITGAANVANPFGVVPRVFGRHRVFPKLAAKQFTEIEGQDQYLVCLFDFGTGPLTLSDFRIGDTPLDDFDDYELTVLNGESGDQAADLVYRNRNEPFPLNSELKVANSWVSFTVSDVNETILDFSWPQGVYVVHEKKGTTLETYVKVNIRYRANGTGSFTDVTDVTAKTGMSAAGKRGPIFRSRRIAFPARGNYEVQYRLSRPHDDATVTPANNVYVRASYITQYRTIQKGTPTTQIGKNCLAALRIKAQAGAQGQIQAFNALAQATLQRWTGSVYTDTTSRHPAWAFLDVCRNAATGRALSSDKIDLDSLLDWATNDPDRTFDAVIDTETTRAQLLRDIAAAGRAKLSMRDGKVGVIRDVAQDTPVQLFTPKNSWGFSGEKVFVDQPHALRCRFLNEDADYQWDERIVYDDGYSASNATKYEQAEMFGVTDADLVWKDGRYLLACGQLRPETWSFFADIEHIVCTRGDLIRVAHDVPNGTDERTQGRIKAVLTDEGSPEMVTGFTLDEAAEMVGGGTYVLQGRKSDGTPVQYSLVTSAGESFDVELLTPVAVASALEVGDLYAFGTAERVSRNMIVTRIQPSADLTAQIFCVDEAPGVHTADTGTIPVYTSGIAAAREITPPGPVENLTLIEDVDPSSQNLTSDLVISWLPSESAVSGYEIWRKITTDDGDAWIFLAATQSTGYRLEAQEIGQEFTIAVIAVSASGRKLGPEVASQATLALVGTPPPDVAGFAISILNDTATLSWEDVAAGTAAYYEIRFSPNTSGVTWGSSAPLLPRVDAISAQIPAMVGTYLIKAVNARGIKSENASSIVSTIAPLAALNAVEEIVEEPGFAGILDQLTTYGSPGDLILDYEPGSPAADLYESGTYYFAGSVDLGEVYTSRLTAQIEAYGLALGDDVFARTDWFEVEDFFNADPSTWGVRIEVRKTDDDPASSPAVWSDWETLIQGDHSARAFEFRAVLTRSEEGITPVVQRLSVSVDMPDRTEAGNDLVVPVTGLRVDFTPAFRSLKGLGISAQGLATGDYYEITNKDETGFDVAFFDAANSPVERTLDYVAVGYGRVAA